MSLQEVSNNEDGTDVVDKEELDSILEMLNKMKQCGYFHSDSTILPQISFHNDYPDDTIEDMLRFKTSTASKQTPCSPMDSNLIITTQSIKSVKKDSFLAITKEKLLENINLCLMEKNRMSIQDLANHFHVDRSILEHCLTSATSTNETFEIVANEVISNSTLMEICHEISRQNIDMKPIRCIAQDFHLPLQYLLTLLTKWISSEMLKEMKIVTSQDGTKLLMSQSYKAKLLGQVDEMLQTAKRPVTMEEIQTKVSVLDTLSLGNHIESKCDKGFYSGSLSIKDSSYSTAVYIPHEFTETQEREVREYFHVNGFITYDYAQSLLGVGKSRLQEIISSHCSSITNLEESIINMDQFILPMQSAVEICDTFLDLAQYLPEGISHADKCQILRDYIPAEGGKLEGVINTASGKEFYLYLSNTMIQKATKELKNHFIDPFATLYVRKHTQNKGAKGKLDTFDQKTMPVPIEALSNHLIEAFPKEFFQDDENGLKVQVAAFEIARYCHDLSSFQSDYKKALIKAIERSKASTAVISSDQSLSSVENTTCFEASFAQNCYTIQLLSKYALDTTSDETEECHYFLSRVAANFTASLTAFCLLKSGSRKDFILTKHGNEGNINEFFGEMSLVSARQIDGGIYLTCSKEAYNNEEGVLQALCNALPSCSGDYLAKMWLLCGMYDGGFTEDDSHNASMYSNRAKVHEFILHAEQSCLSIVGIPFKIMDKKHEKKILIQRKRQMQEMLKAENDPNKAKELSMLILLQRMKNLAIPQLRESHIQDLLEEKKTTESMSEIIRNAMDSDLESSIDAIKELALCKVFPDS